MPQGAGLACIKPKLGETASVSSIDEVRVRHLVGIDRFQNALKDMHRDMLTSSAKKIEAAVDAHNRKTNVRPIKFSEGDFVLRDLP